MVADVVGIGQVIGPDSQADGHFALAVTTSAARTMTSAELSCGSVKLTYNGAAYAGSVSTPLPGEFAGTRR